MRHASIHLLALVAVAAGCDGDSPVDAGGLDAAGMDAGDVDSGGTDPEGFRREITAGFANGVILPMLRTFAERAAALETAAGALAADPASAAARETAQGAWREAMLAWQQLEMAQIGPQGMGGTECPVVGGMDLRDEIYSWNLTSTCRVDQETVGGAHETPEALGAQLVNVRGLDALEYLLFEQTGNNSCSPVSPINADGTWAALGADAVRARRARYAASAATLVAREAAALRDRWEPSGGGFATDLATAGTGGSAYRSTQAAFNDLGGAMLYLDVAARDMKLAAPAGIAGCMADTCFELAEHRYARTSVASVLANVRGFQRLYLGETPGTEGRGWDDLLRSVGAAALADDLAAALVAAVGALEALGTDDLEQAVTENRAGFMAAYEAVGLAQRLFKVDVFTVLDIEPSTCRIGDND
ncbi:MAG: hypothetical protein KF729_03945 [Sandaracinaceae bacterium]|nr:hypothetical protein [Sandaracinaceae bacterium]